MGRIGVFGEVLFDVFPDGSRVLGGAPFNVAWHLQAFGCAPRLVSRVGRDADGDAIVAAMAEWGMDAGEIQSDPARPTGQVIVQLEDGQPTYDILTDQAWDAIDAAQIHETSYALLYHGSLALRSAQPRRAIRELRRASNCTVVMDVNLRDPWWDCEDVLALAHEAHWVKLNDAELTALAPGGTDLESAARAFRQAHDLTGIVVTRGARGAFAIAGDGRYAEAAPSRNTEVTDTVGAGDAFAAVLIAGIVHRWPLETTLERAVQFASVVVRQRGAIISDRRIYDAMINDWSRIS